MHAHARVHACAHHSATASQGCASVQYMCECVCCYYFANPSHCVCLSVCACTSWCLYLQCWGAIHVQQAFDVRSNSCHIHTHTYTHSHTFTTFTHVQDPVNSHEKHAHSRKWWKPGKNAGWQGRHVLMVSGQIKRPVSRRNRESGRKLSGSLRKANKQQEYIDSHTHTYTQYVCLYV